MFQVMKYYVYMYKFVNQVRISALKLFFRLIYLITFLKSRVGTSRSMVSLHYYNKQQSITEKFYYGLLLLNLIERAKSANYFYLLCMCIVWMLKKNIVYCIVLCAIYLFSKLTLKNAFAQNYIIEAFYLLYIYFQFSKLTRV